MPVDQRLSTRIAAILIGAAVLFGLELGLDQPLYVAIPAGILVYLGIRIAVGLMLAETPAK